MEGFVLVIDAWRLSRLGVALVLEAIPKIIPYIISFYHLDAILTEN